VYIDAFVWSIRRGCWPSVRVVIFHDGILSREFCDAHAFDFLSYVRVELPLTALGASHEKRQPSLNDLRFIVVDEFLERVVEDMRARAAAGRDWRVRKVFLTDVSDVVVTRDPGEFDPENSCGIIVGDEKGQRPEARGFVRGNGWLKNKVQRECFDGGTWRAMDKDRVVYNMGLIGGSIENVRSFVRKMRAELEVRYRERPEVDINCNMAVGNVVLHTQYLEKDICHGPTLHSRYKLWERPFLPAEERFFFHK